MRISTKGRYALRLMLDLAEHQGDGCVSLKDVAQRQDISKNTSSRSFRRSAVPASCSRTAAIRAATGWPAGRRTTPRGTFCA